MEFSSVSYSYPGRDEAAVNKISFSLKEGSRVLIFGSNGSGKSTLTRLMTGLLRPDEGSVQTAGLDSSLRENLRAIRSGAGLLFQNPSSQIVATVVREDTAFGPENLALSSSEIRQRVEKALKRSGMYALRRRASHDLSAGQQQRLALAGVLALGSGCLILDEAASMLNPLARKDMDILLDQLHGQGYTIIQVSHFMTNIAKADKILILQAGKLVFEGGTEDFLVRESSLSDWALDLPDIQKLSGELKGLFPELRKTLDEKQLSSDLKPIFAGLRQDPPIAVGETAPPAGPPLLSLHHVNYQYKAQSRHPVTGLIDLDFDFYRDETVVLMGSTGSGKSTFLQMLNLLLLPSSGRISLLGENPLDKKCDLARLRSRMGLVMQQPEKQLFASLVGDDVAFGPRQAGLQGQALSRRVKDALDLMELSYSKFRDRSIRALSGGQKRKVALAGILAMKPEILLLDEPSAGLDPRSAANLERLLLSLRDEGIQLILSTHDVEQALRFDPRLLVMWEGRKVFDGMPEQFFREMDPEQYGLEYPLVLRLWQEGNSQWRESFPLGKDQLKSRLLLGRAV